MRSSEFDSPGKEPDKLDTRTAISSEEKTAIQESGESSNHQNTDELDRSDQGPEAVASGSVILADGQDLFSLPARTLGICTQPRQKPFSDQTPVVPAV